MTITLNKVDARSAIYLNLTENREEAMPGRLVHKATLGKVLKELATLRANDVAGRAELLTMTETVKAQFFLSPNGESVYVLKPTTRVVDGMKRSMLSIKAVVPVSSVLSFEVAR